MYSLIPQTREMLAWHIRKVRRVHFSSDRRVAHPLSCGLTDGLSLAWLGSVRIATLFAHFGPIDRGVHPYEYPHLIGDFASMRSASKSSPTTAMRLIDLPARISEVNGDDA
jgi:hypothetical protein